MTRKNMFCIKTSAPPSCFWNGNHGQKIRIGNEKSMSQMEIGNGMQCRPSKRTARTIEVNLSTRTIDRV